MIQSGMSGHYSHPVQFIQQLDFPTMPSYVDMPGLNDITAIPQSCSVSHHLIPPIDNSFHSCRSVSEFASGRSLANFCKPSSTAAFPDTPTVQGLSGNFLHFQHYSSQIAFRENSYHDAINKSHQFAKPSWHNNSKPLAATGSGCEAVVAENANTTLESVKEQQSCRDKKEKAKKVHFIKPGCSDLCRRCCKQKISQSMREVIFNKYWNLENDVKKKEFIAQNAIKMPMMKCKEGSRRSFSVDWAFLVNGESFSVCKLFFLHTLDIPENSAYAAVKDSTFFKSDTPVIKARGDNKDRPKPTWFETDLDNYSLIEKKRKYSREARCKSFTKNDRFSEMGPGCTKLCRRNCQSKFTREERLEIFTEYRSLCNIRKQRDYISKNINRMERKRIRAGMSTRRGCSIQWKLSSKGREIPVCKTFFLHTVGISERAAYNIGLQNQIKPIERAVKSSVERRSSKILTGKGKRFCSTVAKEKLKSAIKLSRRQKKVVKYDSNTEEDVMSGEFYYDSWKESHRKSVRSRKKCRHKRQKRKQVSVRTVQVEKMKMEKVSKDETKDKENEQEEQKNGTCLKPSTEILNIPMKKRDNAKFRLPIFRIQKGKVFPVLRKQRNPYKRKEVPIKHTYSLCPENCKKMCRINLTEEARREIFKEFWSLKNMEEQRKYIAKRVKKIAKPTCTCLVASHLRGRRRGYTIAWSLSYRGLDVTVCKTYFMHVLQVSDSVVYKAIRENEYLTSDVTVEPCKHFTGQNHVTKQVSLDVAATQKTKYESDKDNQEARRKVDLINVSEENCVNEETRETAAPIMHKSWTTQNMNAGDKMDCSELAQIPVTSVPASCYGSKDVVTNSQHDERAEKILAQVPHCTHNGLCHIEANYDTLFPSLDKHLQDSNHILQVPSPSQQLTSYVPSEKVKNVHNSTQASTSCTNFCHRDFWQKPVDLFHPVFSNNSSVLPAIPNTQMEQGLNFPHPRDFPSHLTFPRNDTHHSYFPAQASGSGNHSVSFTQLYPNIPASHMNYSNQKDFTSATMTRADLYHSTRFHGFPTTVIMPSQCVPYSSNYQAVNDLCHSDSHMVHTQKNTESNICLSNQNKLVKIRKKKVKSSSSSKLKEEKVKMPQVRKYVGKKTFTKHIKEGCLNTCKRKCGLIVPQEARQQIFNEFWGLDNDARRREYILPIVNKVPKKTCSGVNSRRCCTIEWSLPYKEKKHIVCKRFFLDTFDLGEKFIKTVFDKVERKGGSMEDLRGRHRKRSNMFVQEQEEIENNIQSVSTLKAFHCMTCKKDFTRWCLGQGAVVSQLYKTYSDKRKAEGKKPACRTSYTEICNTKFHLKDLTHQDCVCDSCAAHTNNPQDT